MAEGNEPIEGELVVGGPVLVNVSGVEDQPLWVQPDEVAAVGVQGPNDSLIILRGSGFQLRAKGIHPNQVAQLLTEDAMLDKAQEQAAWDARALD